MEWTRMMRGARTLLDDCASVKAGERVLIVTDTKLIRIGEILAAAAYERDTEPVLMVIKPREMDSQEPPEMVAEAMKLADLILLPVTKSITHTRSAKAALEAGARIIVMTAFTDDMLTGGGIEAEFKAQKPVCEKLAALFTGANTARLKTAAGTDLTMNIEGRKGNALTCIVDKPGTFSPVPTIEANISPVEGSSEGRIVADASIPYIGIGLLREPVSATVKKGIITEIRGGEQAESLRKDLEKKNDPNVYNVAEMGVGLNPKSKMIGIMLEDEAVLGSAHIGIGTNITLGGKVKAAVHYDLVLWRPTIELDGKIVMENGNIRFSMN
jgi:leucyl aminopeptidase (aminopeptidase T)